MGKPTYTPVAERDPYKVGSNWKKASRVGIVHTAWQPKDIIRHTGDQRAMCDHIILELLSPKCSDHAKLFYHASNAPGRTYNSVKTPNNFTTVKLKLEAGQYPNGKKFGSDVRNIFTNWLRSNPNHKTRNCVRKTREIFELLFAFMPETVGDMRAEKKVQEQVDDVYGDESEDEENLDIETEVPVNVNGQNGMDTIEQASEIPHNGFTDTNVTESTMDATEGASEFNQTVSMNDTTGLENDAPQTFMDTNGPAGRIHQTSPLNDRLAQAGIAVTTTAPPVEPSPIALYPTPQDAVNTVQPPRITQPPTPHYPGKTLPAKQIQPEECSSSGSDSPSSSSASSSSGSDSDSD